MSGIAVTAIVIGLALAIVFVAALINYVSSLVRNAYQIKVEIRADMEAGMKDLAADMDKKSKWIKSEILEEVSRARMAIEDEQKKRVTDTRKSLADEIEALKKAHATEKAALVQQLNELNAKLTALSDRYERVLEKAREATRAPAPEPVAETPEATDGAAAAMPETETPEPPKPAIRAV